MNKLVVKTTKDDFLLEGIIEEHIYVQDGIIFFGKKAAVNLNSFIEYNYFEKDLDNIELAMNNMQE